MNLNKGTSILTVIIIILVLIIIGGSGVYMYNYYFTLEDQPNNTNKQEKTASDSVAKQAETVNNPKNLNNIQDCGISEALLRYKPINEINIEEDTALVCLGTALVNSHNNPEALIKTEYTETEEIFEITRGDNYNYKIVTPKNSINPEIFNNQYSIDAWLPGYSISCPFEKFLYETKLGSLVIKDNMEKQPGNFALAVYVSLGFAFENPNNNSIDPTIKADLLKIGCNINYPE